MPAKLERCVADVKAKGKAVNPWAVCRSVLGTDAQIRASEGGHSLTAPGGLVQRGGYLDKKHG